MKRTLLLLTLFAASIIGCLPASKAVAQTVSSYEVAKTLGSIGLRISKIEYRKDLTRIYGEIMGRPHTAARIDEMSIKLSSGQTLLWTDIDGFDAKRYFQWEDDGRIRIEIDFPPMKPQSIFTIKASGPKGEFLWTIKKLKKRK